LSGISVAATAALNSTEALEHRLENTKANVAAEATRGLTASYKDLLRVQTDFAQSVNGKAIIGMWANIKSVGQSLSASVLGGLSGNSGAAVGSVARSAIKVDAFRQQSSGVRSDADIDKAIQAGLALSFELEASAKLKSASKETREQILGMADAVFSEVKALENEGQQRVKNNQLADEAAKKEAQAKKLAEEAAKAREEGAKQFAAMQAKEQTAVLSSAKASDPALYFSLLKTNQAALKAKLGSPDATAARYLVGDDAKDAEKVRDAQKAADAYRLEITGKLAVVEKDIQATTEAQAKKTEAEQDRREKAEIRLLQVKAQGGTIDDRIAALTAEKNALDQTDLNYRADALSIELRIARLKDGEAARLRTEASEAQQRAQQAEINRIKDSQFLTDRQKREQLYTAFKREQADIAEKIRIAEGLVDTQSEWSATKAQAQSDLRRLRARQDVSLPEDIAQNKPLGQTGEIGAAMTQLQNGFRTVASSISDLMGSAIGGISDGIQGLIMRTKTWGQAGLAVASEISQSAVKAFSDMAAQAIVKYGIMDNVRRVFHIEGIAQQTVATTAETGIHAAGETAKTGATLGGSLVRGTIRVAETVFHGLQVAWRVTAHVAGEVAKTVATGVQTALRMAMILAESVGQVIKAGVGAMSAVASIPYVGPILAIAALAAVVAAGMAAVKGISKGFATGGYTEQGNRGEVAGTVHKGEWVAPKWMVDSPRFGDVIAGLESERRGGQGYSWGGFVKLLGRGMPRWLQDPITRNLVDKWNPATGTKLYGNPQEAGSAMVMDTRTDAQRSALDDLYVASGASAVGGGGMAGVGSSPGSIATPVGGGDGGGVNMGFFNTRQDVETWLASQRGRRVMIDFIRQQKTEL
jgi:hypothetical protein